MDDKLFKEKTNRIFFLKAILLGIEYAESGKGDELKNIIKLELNKLQSDNNNINNNNNNTQNNNTLNPLNFTEYNPKDNIIENAKNTLQKYEQILHELNNQKLNISNKISNISSQSYMKTLSLQQSQQIQKELFSLKKMILVLNKEIEKYSLLHQSVFKMTIQPKISPQENIMKKNNNHNYLNPSLNNNSLQQNIYSQNNQPFFYKNNINNTNESKNSTKSVSFFPPDNNDDDLTSSPSSFNQNNNNLNLKSDNNFDNNNEDIEDDDSKDLLKELQRTFGNLSSLLNSN